MTFYKKELEKIRRLVYANNVQIDIIKGVRKFIENNYQDNLNLDSLSNNHFVSKHHLLRLFKKYYGITPRQYLTDIRIEKSKEKLKNGMSVTQTCFAVGFESLGSFSSLFKAKTGIAPSAFQKKKQLSRNCIHPNSRPLTLK
ncbi:MAG: helix-turn-helix transcriptional regulator [Saprospiraceae bacterium]|nr:helix-turn-helix transcriptional regulator [Saprospiraceae bacterium]